MMSTATASATPMAAAAGRSKFPFTATQWQELEHQALIYKYMAAGIPIPPDLLFSIKRSFDSSSLSSKLFTSYPPSPLGWNPYQMGYGKKIDPEPGRCRRTDGKKWRCSKEAYPDSKYCERHMHRGKNRSRKPVEPSSLSSSSSSSSSSSASCSSSLTSLTMPNISTGSLLNHNVSSTFLTSPYNNNTNSNVSPYSSLYPHSTPSSYPHKDFSRDQRYFQGIKEEVGEHAFFTESSGSSMRGFSVSSIDIESWPISGLDHSKQSSATTTTAGYPNYNNATSKQDQNKQCYIWGRDFNCELSMKVDEEERENNEKTTPHHFFDEWAPLKDVGNGGVGGGERKYSSWHDSSPSTTQLSISIPSSHHDFFLSNSRSHHHDG